MRLLYSGALMGLVMASSVCAQVMQDAVGDAVARRTDPGADAAIVGTGALPDLVGLEVTGWIPGNAASDPYDGEVDGSEQPDLLHLTVEFSGLVSPPGPLGLDGQDYDPTRYGANPVYGFFEFDLDNDDDSGGEERSVAVTRYLANAARFGSIPTDADGKRLVLGPGDLDSSFSSEPQFERTGAEFVLALCGCWDLTVSDEGGAPDGRFDAGDTWIVRGRFFERAGAFDCLSLMFGNAQDGGPSGFGLYDPVVEVRYRHDLGLDRTMIELVFPITAAGAALLSGEAEQPLDFTFGAGNHYSLEEALVDLQFGALSSSGVCDVYAGDWGLVELHPAAGEYPRPLDPRAWGARALVGTAYVEEQPGSTYAWTDIAFGDRPGDVNGDGLVDADDLSDFDDVLEYEDGGSIDADGTVDGRLTIGGFGPEFSLFDLDYSGDVGPEDRLLIDVCLADVNGDGILDLGDISAFVDKFLAGNDDADINGDEVLDNGDIFAFVDLFQSGCT